MKKMEFVLKIFIAPIISFSLSCCMVDGPTNSQTGDGAKGSVKASEAYVPRRTVLDFPAPQWEVGDWWEVVLQGYVTEEEVRKQPMGYDLKEGWTSSLQRWRYEVIGTEVVRGDDCFVVRISKGGEILQLWHRKSDLLLMRQMWDSAINEKQRMANSRDAWKFKPTVREMIRIEPIGRQIYSPPPLAMPVFGEAYEGAYNQKSEEIDNDTVLKMTNEKIRDRVRSILGSRSAKITINTSGGGIYPDSQYWNSGIPWCVFGNARRLKGPKEQSRYWLADFGKKGEARHDEKE